MNVKDKALRVFNKGMFIYKIGDEYYVFGNDFSCQVGNDFEKVNKEYKVLVNSQSNEGEIVNAFRNLKKTARRIKATNKTPSIKRNEFDQYNFNNEELSELAKQCERYENLILKFGKY